MRAYNIPNVYLLEALYSRTTACMDPEDARCAIVTFLTGVIQEQFNNVAYMDDITALAEPEKNTDGIWTDLSPSRMREISLLFRERFETYCLTAKNLSGKTRHPSLYSSSILRQGWWLDLKRGSD